MSKDTRLSNEAPLAAERAERPAAGQPFVYLDITRQSYRQYRLFLPARTASLRQGPLP